MTIDNKGRGSNGFTIILVGLSGIESPVQGVDMGEVEGSRREMGGIPIRHKILAAVSVLH